MVFSNHVFHRAEPLKKDDICRPVYVMRLIPIGARLSRHRCNVFVRHNYPGPVARLLKTEPPELFVEDEDGYSQQNGMEGFKDWMSHYSFQESSVVRLLLDVTDSTKRLASCNQSVSLPACLDESFTPEIPRCLMTFADSLKKSVPSDSRLQDFHKLISQLASVKALEGLSTNEELDKLLEGTFAKDAESRQRAGQVYDFLRKRPEWSLQLRLTVVSGPMGFFHPPGWTVETLDHYMDHMEFLDDDMVRAYQHQRDCILAKAGNLATTKQDGQQGIHHGSRSIHAIERPRVFDLCQSDHVIRSSRVTGISRLSKSDHVARNARHHGFSQSAYL